MKIAILVAILLGLGLSLSYASDMALYTGHTNPGWYTEAKMLDDAKKIVDGVKDLFKEVKTFNDDQLDELKAWAEANMNDGEFDIIWLPGVMPSVLYPNPNLKPDDSIAERWLDNGNMFINTGDWFAYCTYETGARGADNGSAGAENILDLKGIIRFGDNTVVDITEAGKKYIPSLGKQMTTDRPIVKSSVTSPWEIAEIFGQAGNDMDPVVLHNTDTDGYIAFINQATNAHAVDRAQATIEFIKNWVTEVVRLTPVEPHGKLTTTWGEIKR